MLDERLNGPWRALRITFGAVPIIAGMDKFTNLLTDWTQYLSPLVDQLLPISASMFMQLVGVIEIVAGLLVLTMFTRVGAYIISGWLVAIAINLVTTGRFFDVVVRDLAMAVGAFALARLTEARERTTKHKVARPRRSVASGDETDEPLVIFSRGEAFASNVPKSIEGTPPHETL